MLFGRQKQLDEPVTLPPGEYMIATDRSPKSPGPDYEPVAWKRGRPVIWRRKPEALSEP